MGVAVAVILGLVVGQLSIPMATESMSRDWMLAVCTFAAMGSGGERHR